MNSKRNWFFHKRISWARRALSSKSGLRLLSRAMPKKIEYVGICSGKNVFVCPPEDFVSRKILLNDGWFVEETNTCLAAYRSRFGSQPTHYALEAGGHIGTQSVQISRSGQFSSVIAVEPVVETFRLLCANIALNDCVPNIIPVNVGISRESGYASQQSVENNIGATRLLADLTNAGSKSDRLRLQSVTEILDQHSFDPEDLGLLWLDAEGMEPEIFESVLSSNAKPNMAVVEFSPNIYSIETRHSFIDQLRQNFTTVEKLDTKGLTPMVWDDLSHVKQTTDFVFSRV